MASGLLGINGFLIDLDGVLYVGDEVIEGAVAALEAVGNAPAFRCGE
jgi:ribonucleotide monophosphatase NagD (HAD superfamily)